MGVNWNLYEIYKDPSEILPKEEMVYVIKLINKWNKGELNTCYLFFYTSLVLKLL